MQRKYQLPLGYLARVLLWSNGELATDETVESEIQTMVSLLRAKLNAVERQLIETAAVRRARSESSEPRREERDGLEATNQEKLPWEA